MLIDVPFFVILNLYTLVCVTITIMIGLNVSVNYLFQLLCVRVITVEYVVAYPYVECTIHLLNVL